MSQSERITIAEGVFEISRGLSRIEIKFTVNDRVRMVDRCFYDTELGMAWIRLEPNVADGGEQ